MEPQLNYNMSRMFSLLLIFVTIILYFTIFHAANYVSLRPQFLKNNSNILLPVYRTSLLKVESASNQVVNKTITQYNQVSSALTDLSVTSQKVEKLNTLAVQQNNRIAENQNTKTKEIQDSKTTEIQPNRTTKIQASRTTEIQASKTTEIQGITTGENKQDLKTSDKQSKKTRGKQKKAKKQPSKAAKNQGIKTTEKKTIKEQYSRMSDQQESKKQERANRQHLLLYVGIFTAAPFTSRRNAIRETWMKECSLERGVVCKFFTDALDQSAKPIPQNEMQKLKEESKKYNDLSIVDSPRGWNFALRFLVVIDNATREADFDYFLRVDDDHYVCLDRLIKELPHRPKYGLYWGWQHCSPGITRIDEGWVLLSSDLIQHFIAHRQHLFCHKGGDIAIAMWIEELEKSRQIRWFADNSRIIHHPPVATYIKAFVSRRKEICHSYISIHGVYGKETYTIHNIHLQEKLAIAVEYKIPPIIDRCQKTKFNWRVFFPPYHAQPRLCRTFPLWGQQKVYPGRTGGKY